MNPSNPYPSNQNSQSRFAPPQPGHTPPPMQALSPQYQQNRVVSSPQPRREGDFGGSSGGMNKSQSMSLSGNRPEYGSSYSNGSGNEVADLTSPGPGNQFNRGTPTFSRDQPIPSPPMPQQQRQLSRNQPSNDTLPKSQSMPLNDISPATRRPAVEAETMYGKPTLRNQRTASSSSITAGPGSPGLSAEKMREFDRLVELIEAQPQKTYMASPPELEMILARTSAGGQPK
jgi:CCR4-NOT transcriptional complex subunit CAF120